MAAVIISVQTVNNMGKDQSQEIEQLRTENSNLKTQIEMLQETKSENENESNPFAISEDEEKVIDDLMNQTALIPIDAQLGGTMRFYSEKAKVLNERYAYAYAEDGHVAVDMIFQYSLQPDGKINWKLAMYDTGEGWQVAD